MLLAQEPKSLRDLLRATLIPHVLASQWEAAIRMFGNLDFDLPPKGPWDEPDTQYGAGYADGWEDGVEEVFRELTIRSEDLETAEQIVNRMASPDWRGEL